MLFIRFEQTKPNMEDNFFLISVIVIVAVNFIVYYIVKNQKKERELKDYFKRGSKKNK